MREAGRLRETIFLSYYFVYCNLTNIKFRVQINRMLHTPNITIFTFCFRLKTSGEEIIEILFSKGKVISALSFAHAQEMERQVPARKFLQVAKSTEDQEIYMYTRNWLEKHQLLSSKDAHDYPVL